MCFGIRISRPFHLNTLNIPIQNIKCPKNTKNACPDIIFSPAIICEAWTVSSLHKHAKPNLCDWQCNPWITLFGAMLCAGICDQRWKSLQSFVISSSKNEMGFHVFHPSSLLHFRAQSTHDSIVMSAHAFLVFLGHLIFWMGMFKVFRWNGLEILITKHMWKSIIGPLEQI